MDAEDRRDGWQSVDARYDRIKTVATYGYLSGYAIPLIVTSFLAYRRGDDSLSIVLGCFALAAILMFIYVLRRGVNLKIRAALVAVVCTLFLWLLLDGGYADTGLLWNYAIIIVIYHFSTAMAGLAVSLALIGAAAIALLHPAFDAMRPDYEVATSSRFLLTSAITSVLIFVYALLQEVLATRLREIQEELLQASMTDELTGLTNRRFMNEVLRIEERRYTGDRQLAVIVADVDRFKRVNDSLGHSAGDEALRHIADVFRSALRKSDRIARWGGEEFLILLDVRDADEAGTVTEKLRAKLEATPLVYDGQSLAMTASFGIKTVDSPAVNLQSAVIEADANLLRAKELGRNRVVAS